VEWTLLACLAQLGRPDGTSAYLRLSTRSVDQNLAAVPADPAARERRRRQVVAGAYCLRRTPNPQVTIAAMGALIPEALAAAERLDASGVPADVICVTSPGLLFKALQARQGQAKAPSWILDQVFPSSRATPLVTVLDGHPHTLGVVGNGDAHGAWRNTKACRAIDLLVSSRVFQLEGHMEIRSGGGELSGRVVPTSTRLPPL
jgi:pyruvate dehydrogenase E1 component